MSDCMTDRWQDELNTLFAAKDQRLAELEAINADLLAALQAVVFDICDYERINNLAPNPGRQDCWASVTQAKAAIARAQGKG